MRRFQETLGGRASLLESLSPIRVLSRGYCMAFRDGKAVVAASELQAGDRISLRFRDGTASASVVEGQYEKESKL